MKRVYIPLKITVISLGSTPSLLCGSPACQGKAINSRGSITEQNADNAASRGFGWDED
jgi:hypothetical protein